MLKLYNTMSHTVEPFEPLDPPRVGLYTCGPTVYNYAHIGNLRTYLFEDVLKRTLIYCGYRVQHVMNVTDVGHLVSDADEGEDKMELGARREGKSVWEIADHYWQAFRRDLAALRVLEPDIWCKATDHIQDMIEQIQVLERKGFTYRTEDGIYFDTSKLPDYGKLARLDREQLRAGARVALVPGKRHPTDFALWKFSPKDKQRLMEWDSPWGVGFPGWHIECSTMAMKYLGEQFDVHCGGVDHIKVHHTNEIAQAEAATGKKPWVRYWLHGEFLVLEEAERMSKSSGEFLTLTSLQEEGFEPLAYRYFCLGAHYRKQLRFSREALAGAARGLARFKELVLELKARASGSGPVNEEHLGKFTAALTDDLNAPQALAVAWALVRDEALSPEERLTTLVRMDEVLGLGVETWQPEPLTLAPEVAALVRRREEARRARDFATADRLREELRARGYLVEDTAEGPKLKRVSVEGRAG